MVTVVLQAVTHCCSKNISEKWIPITNSMIYNGPSWASPVTRIQLWGSNILKYITIIGFLNQKETAWYHNLQTIQSVMVIHIIVKSWWRHMIREKDFATLPSFPNVHLGGACISFHKLMQDVPISQRRRICMDCPKNPFKWALTNFHRRWSFKPSFWLYWKQMHLKEEFCRSHFCKNMKHIRITMFMQVCVCQTPTNSWLISTRK